MALRTWLVVFSGVALIIGCSDPAFSLASWTPIRVIPRISVLYAFLFNIHNNNPLLLRQSRKTASNVDTKLIYSSLAH